MWNNNNSSTVGVRGKCFFLSVRFCAAASAAMKATSLLTFHSRFAPFLAP